MKARMYHLGEVVEVKTLPNGTVVRSSSTKVAEFCVDNKIHVERRWLPSGGYVFSYRPCIGDCAENFELPTAVAQAVQRALETDRVQDLFGFEQWLSKIELRAGR